MSQQGKNGGGDLLPLETYAKVRAHLERYEDSGREVVLSVLEVSPALYDNSDGYWTNEIAQELRAKRRKIGPTWERLLRAAQDELEKQGLTLAEIAAQRRAAAVPAAPTPAPAAAPARAPAPPAAAPGAPPPPVRPAPLPDAAGASPWLRGAAPSFARAPSTPPPPAEPPAPPPLAAAPPPSARKGATAAMPAFSGPQPPHVPFVQRAQAEVLRSIEIVAEQSPLPPPEEGLAATVAGAAPASSRPLPFAEQPLPLTLQQYASVFIELRCYPAAEADVLRRYGLPSLAAFRLVDDAWKARFEQDAGLRSAWIGMCHTYRAWLAKNPIYR